MTRSKPARLPGGRVPSATMTPPDPAGATADRTSRARCSRISAAVSRAPVPAASPASSRALPPGPAQRSSHARRARRRPTLGERGGRELAGLVLNAGPARGDGARPPPGRPRPGSRRTSTTGPARSRPRRVPAGWQGQESRTGAPPGARRRRPAAASVCGMPPSGASPSAAANASTIQRGWLYRTARWPTGSASRPGAAMSSQAARSLVATRRSTALTKPAGRCPAVSFTRSTEVATAACGWILVASS